MLYNLMLYTLKVGGCLAAFYLFFKLFLSRETLHRLNRVVVLSVLVLSFVLPFCVVTIREEVAPVPVSVEQPMVEVAMPLPVEEPFPWREGLGALFLAGVVVMLLRFAGANVALGRLIGRSPKERFDDRVTIVYADHPQSPFSWFRYLVVGEDDLVENGDAIMAHERAHIRLGHSWDLLLFDLLGAMQWFNPAMWLLRRDLKAIHEYEADRAVLDGGADARAYQLLLIKKAAGERWCSVANSFNHSKLKNRITMMIQKRSSRWAAAKVLLLLPLVGVALGAFAETVYVVTDNKGTTKNETLQPSDEGILKLRFRDEKGAAVAGVTVVKAGTYEGVCSDPEGYAELNVKSGDRLNCMMVGRTTVNYEVSKIPAEEVQLTMYYEDNLVEGIVVAGHGAQKKPSPAVEEGEAVPFMLVDDERKKEIMEQAKAEPETVKVGADDELFMIVEQMPKFQGGDINAFRQWVQMRVQYPEELQQTGVEGLVIVSFVVEKDGSVTEVVTRRTPDKRLSDMVENLVRQSPEWEPGKQRGQAQRVQYTLPIEFKTLRDEPSKLDDGQQAAMREMAESARAKGHEVQKFKGRLKSFAAAEESAAVGKALFEGRDYRAFQQWAQSRLQYPEDAKKAGVEGEVFVTFVVKANGTIGDVDVIGEADKRLAQEAVRVVKSSPKWTPAKKNGKDVAAKYGIKLRFKAEADDEVFMIVEQMPTFEGGDFNHFREWMLGRIQPQKGDDGNLLSGMVIVQFVVECDGSIADITPMRSPDKRLTAEVVRLLHTSPKWEPGKQRGQTVRVRYTLPITFKGE